MSAPKGNKFWTVRAKSGRDKTFKTPDSLWSSCCEYFEWVEEHPLWESRPFAYQGVVTQEPVAKMRAMTISGLCLFLDIDLETWRRYRVREDFRVIIAKAEQVIWDQKFAGASADLLNANIISRELGLADKQESKTTVTFDDISDEELDAKIQAHLNK